MTANVRKQEQLWDSVMQKNVASAFKVVVSGSFRKHFNEICELIRSFNVEGMSVLSPKVSRVVNPGEDFAILESDDTTEPKELEVRHLEAISEADCVYFYNPDGYMGASATMELGYAISIGKPLFFLEKPADFTLALFGDMVVSSAKEVQAALEERQNNIVETLSRNLSLPSLQRYVHDMVRQRGFADESPRDIMLLMVEEVGELAKSIRKDIGLKVDLTRPGASLQLGHEMADVLIYLLDLANTCNIDLASALHLKETENAKRFWEKIHH